MYSEEEVRETVNWKAVYEESLSMQRTSNAGYESKINELKEKIKTMYSEKEVLELLRKAHFVEQNIEEWFEQFKKKINARKFEKRKPH
jgi:phage shock protein A